MATQWYRLKNPVEHIEVAAFHEGDIQGNVIRVTTEDGAVGKITLSSGLTSFFFDILMALADICGDDHPLPLRTLWGGIERGMLVLIQDNHQDSLLRDDTQLISEYGDLATVGEIQAMEGRGGKCRES